MPCCSLNPMEPSTENLGFIPSWLPNCSSESSASYSLDASSAIVSHASADGQCESSTAQTDSSPFKERDYIGLSEYSSTASFAKVQQQKLDVRDDANEPDLQLGLGPSSATGAREDGSLQALIEPQRDDTKGKTPCPSKPDVAEAIYSNGHIHPHSSSTIPAKSMKRSYAQPVCSVVSDPFVNCSKPPFPDTVCQAIPDAELHEHAISDTAGDDTKTGSMLTAVRVRRIMQKPAMEAMSAMRHPKMVFLAAPRSPVSWNADAGHTVSSYGGHVASGKPGGLKEKADLTLPCCKMVMRTTEPEQDAPPAKEQMVGWPPVRSYRRRSVVAAAQSCRLAEVEEIDSPLAIFVKVNMDGVPIGRKVGVNSYTSYEELLAALEGMFYSPHMGESRCSLHACDYVLMYEDKEGDWMLVGDVPWSMFVNTVKRLRIMKGPDSSCLG